MIPDGYITKLKTRAEGVSMMDLLLFIEQLQELLQWAKNFYIEREMQERRAGHK